MFPKEGTKKHNKNRHISNSRPTENDFCLICGQPFAQTHEVFYGDVYLRNMSYRYGCQERLCAAHHLDTKIGVHNNKHFDNVLKIKHQERLEGNGMTRSEFIRIFKKSYAD